jgi:hypothetical protein
MKTDKLKLHIRKIVREEVAMAIQEVITELKEPTVDEKSGAQKPKRKKVIKEKRQFSSNSVLNDVLNETANSDISLDDYGADVMGGTDEIVTEGINDVTHGAPDFMTRDYSSVVQKSYDKTKAKLGTA